MTADLKTTIPAEPTGRIVRTFRAVSDVIRDLKDTQVRARARYPYLEW